jgi:hypothetical protein
MGHDEVLAHGLTDAEFTRLAVYNGEVARGILHTEEWADKMALLQERYNQAMTRRQ